MVDEMTGHRYSYLVWDGSMRVRLDAEPHRQLISLHWNMGKRFHEVPAIKAKVSVAKADELPDHIVIGNINYVSERLKGILDDVGASVQCLPVVEMRSRRGDSIESPRFYAVNFLVSIPCFDFEHAEYTRRSEQLGGGIERIARLEILEPRLEGAPVAVMDELGELLVRRDVVERLREAGIHGCRWREIEDVRLPQTDWPAES
jgi:hypothetical protein